ncbi:histidine kinase dimerization/phosphoacceptor domain -containing protein [Flavobacterium agrisoli]|uniref:histidine kinase n=1 Tax=Flavobacterium agrisoli TaxID=2793066 RepID=A0A934PJ33_9FLAO|nr:histidine kinase dimerization/phosphoacceptor domain -containing protein [Flavobacterium agrisoli]MBK0368319.1 tetratricopeptide repeat protein [Flavobacterium agrisoli]
MDKFVSAFFIAFIYLITSPFVYSQKKDISENSNSRKNVKVAITKNVEMGKKYLYKPESFRSDMDSANFYFKKALKLATAANFEESKYAAYYYLAETCFEEMKFQEGYTNYYKVIDYYQKHKWFEKEAETWLTMGIRTRNEISIDNPLFDTGEVYLKNALALYRKLGSKPQEISVMKELGDYYLNKGELLKSEDILLQVLEQYKQINFKRIYHTYNLMCVLYRLKGDYNKSIYNGLLAVDLMIKEKDTSNAPFFYGNLGDCYRELGDVNESVRWYKKVFENWEKIERENRAYLYRNLNFLSKELVLLKKAKEALDFSIEVSRKKPPITPYQQSALSSAKAVAYYGQNKFDLAEIEYNSALNALVRNKNSSYFIFISEALLDLGDFYLKQGLYNKAKKYINASLQIPKGITTQSKIKDAHLMLFKIDSTQGNYLKAISYYQIYKRINDSIFNEVKSKQIEELRIKYETIKKENDIKLLRNQNLEQNYILTRSNLQRNYILIGFLLLLVLSIFLYRSHIRKRRTNRLLVSQKGEIAQQNNSLQELLKEKEWLLKEIHHRVKNNLQIVMSLLNTQANYITNPAAISAIQNSQHRLYAISLIHQKLYKTEDSTRIDMHSYIKDLVGYLRDSYDVDSYIEFKLNIEHIMLHESMSIPVGLILNEAITNAIKYAFPNKQKGIVAITIVATGDNYRISIEDDGVGIPESYSHDATLSLGLTLIKGLTKQLDGTIEVRSNNGTMIEIVFKEKLNEDSFSPSF